jgi:hypothetical protein
VFKKKYFKDYFFDLMFNILPTAYVATAAVKRKDDNNSKIKYGEVVLDVTQVFPSRKIVQNKFIIHKQ